jgi:E3 SUMO-protein ligase PIAS1/E3 SUMO-protein ligase PIAS2
MKSKGIKPADYTRGLIKEKFNEDADCEIATTLLKVSLICPLGKMRMTTPCRASTCLHLQCFDASLYLQMNERKPTWNCPVCDKPALYENLVIDGYFQEVVASNKLSSDDNEIQLHKDGSWSTLLNKSELCSLDTPMKTQKIEVISDDIELITDIPKPTIKSQLTYSSNGNENGSNGESTVAPPPGDTVDLTMSDSDDEMPLKKTCTRSTQNSKSKTSDNLNTTIIMLDSPSPPSRSPQHSSNHANYQSNFGNAYNEIAGSGRHINPFAAYDLSIDPFENTTRQSTNNVPNNVNIVRPFSENSHR